MSIKLGPILKQLMAEQGLSESELARRTGIGQPVIHRMASGETDNPKVATLSPVANYFALSISQLIGDDALPADRVSGTHNPTSVQLHKLPILTWEQAILWPEKKSDVQVAEYTATDMEVGENAYVLRVKDTTMRPRFPEDTLIVVDPSLKPQDRDFAIVHIDSYQQALFRQVLVDGGDTYLKPLNADFKIILLSDRYKTLGVMVQARSDFKRG